MSVTVETISNLERRMTISMPVKPLEEEVNQRISKLARTAKMAGFRPGKVPVSLVQQQHGPQVRDEVFSGAVERSFMDAVEEKKLRVAGFPNIEHKPFVEASGEFEYVATFEVFPEVTIGDLSKIKIERPVLEVSEADVKKTMAVLVEQRATYEPVKRASKKGDRVNLTLSASIDGKQVESTGPDGLTLILGAEGHYPEFDEHLADNKPGSNKTFKIKYPKNHKPGQLAGKTVSYDVTFNSVEQPKLPEIDADFARSLGVEDGNVDKMYAEIKESLGQEVTKRIKAKLKEQVFQALIDNIAVEVPRALIGTEIDRLMQMTQQNLQQRGVDMSNVNIEPAMFEEQARRGATLRLILVEIIKKNDLQANPDQIKEMVKQFGQSFEQPDEVERWYYSDPKRLDEPAALATEENVVAWVLDTVKVTDKKVKFDDLMGNA